MGRTSCELQYLTNGLYERTATNGLEGSIDKSNIMMHSTFITSADFTTNGEKLE
ncbi:hypothetical protein DPMN_174871 [Dreissena polymorpha]|uniref:Uncharacterized protein n=1 Tax=Dreissena polymorpha TaxID=45954 RepID=A0A9D4IHJ3_DREPO|nr:hypothetical protein DPMN_174871 [Dreissena polymorpha]